MDSSAIDESAQVPLRRLQQLLLVLLAAGISGLELELVLLEHTESVWQWMPLVLLGAGLITTIAMLARPNRAMRLAFRAAMALLVIVGLLGVYLHFQGNIEFAREHDPAIKGLALIWESLRGATPSLAPGAMAQLGVLGLLTQRNVAPPPIP